MQYLIHAIATEFTTINYLYKTADKTGYIQWDSAIQLGI